MSRSFRKHNFLKYGSFPRTSWKKWKIFVNRHNRRKSKFVLRVKEEFLYEDKKLCYWDYDFCKWYYPERMVKKNYKLVRK